LELSYTILNTGSMYNYPSGGLSISMSLSFKCNEVVINDDLVFEGFSFSKEGIIGFKIILPDYTILRRSETIILLIECSDLTELSVNCYNHLNNVILKYADVVEGPKIVYEGKRVELPTYPGVISIKEWPKAIVTIYSVIPRILSKGEIKRILGECNLERKMEKEVFNDFLENLKEKVSAKAVSDLKNMLDSIEKILKDEKSGNMMLLFVGYRYIIDGIWRLKEYINANGKYKEEVKRAYDLLKSIEEEIKHQLQALIGEIRRHLSCKANKK